MVLFSNYALPNSPIQMYQPYCYTLKLILFFWTLLSLTQNCTSILPESYKIHNLPGIDNNKVQQYSGYLKVNDDVRIFFWLVLKEPFTQFRDNLLIWLNGGPGCSSLEGMVLENGPYLVDEKGNLQFNPNSWHHYSSLLYVDQPVGTGFSYSKSHKLVTSQIELSQAFVETLEAFFKEFPDFQASNLYLSGESFAGIYLPYIAKAIIDRNESPGIHLPWKLKGLLIGNGWIDPWNQYWGLLEYAKQRSLVSGKWLDLTQKKWETCLAALNLNGNLIRINSCESIPDPIFDQSMDNEQNCINMYDIRLRDPKPGKTCGNNWPPTLPGAYVFFKNKDVITAIHANDAPAPWMECSNAVYNALMNDRSEGSITLFPYLLSHLQIVLYSGEYDLVCNHVGTEKMIQELTWLNHQGFSYAYPNVFFLHDQSIGIFQQERNLTYIRFSNASHMVPIDQPEGMNQALNILLNLVPPYTYLVRKSPKPLPVESTSTIFDVLIPRFWAGFSTGIFFSILFFGLTRYLRIHLFFMKSSSKLFASWTSKKNSYEEYQAVHVSPKEAYGYDLNSMNHVE